MAAKRGRPTIAFRVDPDVEAALRRKAEEEGVEWSAFWRQIACLHAEIGSKHPKKGRKVPKKGVCKPKSGANTPKRVPKDEEEADMRFIRWFQGQYLAELQIEYVPAWGRDRRIARRLLSKLEGRELARRVLVMLRTRDEFIVRTGRDMTVLERWINRFADNGRVTPARDEPKGLAGVREYMQQNLIEDTEQPPP